MGKLYHNWPISSHPRLFWFSLHPHPLLVTLEVRKNVCLEKQADVQRVHRLLSTSDINQSFLPQTEQLDLTNCDKEPIHIPGAIQPHGLLLALQEPDLTIVQISANVQTLLAFTADELLGQSLAVLLADEQLTRLQQYCLLEDLSAINPLKLMIQSKQSELLFDGIVHRVDGLLVLELEPAQNREYLQFPSFHHAVRASLATVQRATAMRQLCQSAAEEVRKLTGFDRVMIYRFHPDWHGEVVAEAKRADLTPYLGLHYPASDIPAQARELYRHNWLRLIADVAYRPAPLVPPLNPLTNAPLNMSASVLRSVSPVHIQYLKNMGVGASMSVSLLKHEQLWGLISCHHETAHYVPYEVRTACEFLGQMLSLQISAQEEQENYVNELRVKDMQTNLIHALLQDDHGIDALIHNQSALLAMVSAQGAVLAIDDHYVALGETPGELACRELLTWLKENIREDIFYTANLSAFYPAAVNYQDVASGLLALSISPLQGSYVLWFRPEVLETVEWGGNPEKPVEMVGEQAVLHPRSSFAAWSQMVHQTSPPWQPYELAAARALRSALLDRVLSDLLRKRAAEMAQLNAALEQSNSELDAFAYIVSHDLKEPLRGIRSYVQMLREDYSEHLDEQALTYITTLVRLSLRMDDLIASLLHYSRVGRVELSFAQTDLDEIVSQVCEMLKTRIDESGVEIRIPRPLPTVWCDRVRIGEVFSNLIVNALKYNDKEQKWIEIGYQESVESDDKMGKQSQPIVFFVRDNGIGIKDKYYDSIFRIFKRLHGREAFGGGTGAGLTIVKRIVERHNGTIWVESTYGQGTTFYFTLQGEH